MPFRSFSVLKLRGEIGKRENFSTDIQKEEEYTKRSEQKKTVVQLAYSLLHFKFAAIEKVEQFTCCFSHLMQLFCTDRTLKTLHPFAGRRKTIGLIFC